jgi:hypothetical protein
MAERSRPLHPSPRNGLSREDSFEVIDERETAVVSSKEVDCWLRYPAAESLRSIETSALKAFCAAFLYANLLRSGRCGSIS